MNSASSTNTPQQWNTQLQWSVCHVAPAQSSMVRPHDHGLALQQMPGAPAGIWMCDATAPQCFCPMQSSLSDWGSSGACAPTITNPSTDFAVAGSASIHFMPRTEFQLPTYRETSDISLPVASSSCMQMQMWERMHVNNKGESQEACVHLHHTRPHLSFPSVPQRCTDHSA